MRILLIVSAGALAVAALPPTAASGAPASATGNGKATVLIPLTLTRMQDLDFGTVITSSTAGTVAIDASTGSRTVSGGVTAVTSAPGARAIFQWAGTPNQLVNFTVTPPATLNDGLGDTITVAGLTLSPTSATVDTTRVVTVGVGGTIDVAANQMDGVYTNTFTVTANYN